MEPIKINRKSWHYRWMCFIGSDPRYWATNSCEYVFSFITGTVLSVLIAMIGILVLSLSLIMFVASPIIALLWLIDVQLINDALTTAAINNAIIAGIFLGVATVVVSFYYIMKVIERNVSAKESSTVQLYKSYTQKICRKVVFINDDN